MALPGATACEHVSPTATEVKALPFENRNDFTKNAIAFLITIADVNYVAEK